jgi:hypothetical protein
MSPTVKAQVFELVHRNMLTHSATGMAKRYATLSLQALLVPQRFSAPKHSRRTLSTMVEGERYWKQTPWKDVPAEEFNSYRWQVRGLYQHRLRLHTLQTSLDTVL